MNRKEWLEQRKTGIGSSDCAAVLGASRWKTALQVQAEKLGRMESEEDNSLLELGRLMEPVILRLYAKQTGTKPRRSWQICRSEQYPWMIASLDATVGSPWHPLEIKNVIFPRGKWGKEADEVPEEYVLQVQHQMAVTDKPLVELPVLMFGKLRIYKVERHQKLIDIIVEREHEFWQKHILEGEPVAPDFEHPSTVQVLNAITGVNGNEIPLYTEHAEWAEHYKRLGKEIAKLEDEKRTMQARLLDAMGDAALAHLPNGWTLTRKRIHRDQYVIKETDYTRFNVNTNNIEMEEM